MHLQKNIFDFPFRGPERADAKITFHIFIEKQDSKLTIDLN